MIHLDTKPVVKRSFLRYFEAKTLRPALRTDGDLAHVCHHVALGTRDRVARIYLMIMPIVTPTIT